MSDSKDCPNCSAENLDEAEQCENCNLVFDEGVQESGLLQGGDDLKATGESPPISTSAQGLPPPPFPQSAESGLPPPPPDFPIPGMEGAGQSKSSYTVPIVITSALIALLLIGASVYYIFFQDTDEMAVLGEEITGEIEEEDENAGDEEDNGDSPDSPGVTAPGGSGNGPPRNGDPVNGPPRTGDPGNGDPGNGDPGNGTPGPGPTTQQHAILSTSFVPQSGAVLPPGTRVNYTFNYSTSYRGNVHIVATPMRGGEPIPNATGNLSGNFPTGQGRGSGYFIIPDGRPVDGFRISMYPAFIRIQFTMLDRQEYPVDFRFQTAIAPPDEIAPPDPDPPDEVVLANSITDINFNQAFGTYATGTWINFSYNYTKNHPGAVAVSCTALSNGNAINFPNALYSPARGHSDPEGSGSGSFMINIAQPVNQLRFRMVAIGTTNVLHTEVVNIYYNFEEGQPQIANSISNIRFNPPPGTYEPGTYISFNYDYTTNHSGDVKIFGRALRNGNAITHASYSSSNHSSLQGRGTGHFKSNIAQSTDQFKVFMYAADTNELLHTEVVNANYKFEEVPVPVACFEIRPSTEIVAGATVVFDASCSTGTGNLRYSWNFGDNTPETGRSFNPERSHTYSHAGLYEVKLTLWVDDSIAKTERGWVYVLPRDFPRACFEMIPESIIDQNSTTVTNDPAMAAVYVGEKVRFDPDCSSGAIISATWSIVCQRTGQTIHSEDVSLVFVPYVQGISYVFSKEGRYDVTLKVADSFGNRYERKEQILVLNPR